MPALNITEDALRRLAVPESGRAVFTDTKLKGFSVVVGRQSRSFYAQRDVRGKTHKVFLGRHGQINVVEARKAAEDVIHGMSRGEARYLERENPTLRSALDGYAMCGPSIYTTATIPQLAQFLDAETTNIHRD